MDTNIVHLAVATIYYLFLLGVGFLSLFGLYLLLRYGENRTLTVTVSIVYIALFLILVSASSIILQKI